ncbi:RNA polymerase sigma factor [Sphaerisporangium viridialbum]|uniref:RNA polymerase sigma factor n=1 Tax=Sphaerisporangium viridialbum TaxID=46189 RepID=UPI003C739FA4
MSALEADGTPDSKSWIEDNHARLLRLALLFTRDPRLAEDIAQEACLKIMRAWPKKPQRDSIITSPGYVVTIVKNACRTHWKAHSRRNEFETSLEPECDPEFKDADVTLRDLLVDLPEDEHAMLILRYYEGETILEAGRQLGLSRDRAYRLHDRALETLRARFKDQED